jgi:predicted RNase H-like nuclease (RuvC/YqgF family)
MTEQPDPNQTPRVRTTVQRLAHPFRRALAPAALELRGQVESLTVRTDELRDGAAELHRGVDQLRSEADQLRRELGQARQELQEVGALRSRVEEAERRVAAAEAHNAELRDGLEESRRLNLRVAELVDVVTELVLPLHDREIDPAALGRLRPDTL